jgi:uncharacterized membrane protein
MTTKVNGAVYPGVYVEKQVAFVKITFNVDVSVLAATTTYLTGTTTATGTGTVSDSTFGIVESAVVQALKAIETNATILGVSIANNTGSLTTVDVMVGFADAFFSDSVGVISTTSYSGAVSNAHAIVKTAGTNTVAGQLVDVMPSAVTFTLKFAALDGQMTVATVANFLLEATASDGASSGTAAAPMGTTGYKPVELATV